MLGCLVVSFTTAARIQSHGVTAFSGCDTCWHDWQWFSPYNLIYSTVCECVCVGERMKNTLKGTFNASLWCVLHAFLCMFEYLCKELWAHLQCGRKAFYKELLLLRNAKIRNRKAGEYAYLLHFTTWEKDPLQKLIL